MPPTHILITHTQVDDRARDLELPRIGVEHLSSLYIIYEVCKNMYTSVYKWSNIACESFGGLSFRPVCERSMYARMYITEDEVAERVACVFFLFSFLFFFLFYYWRLRNESRVLQYVKIKNIIKVQSNEI